MVKIGPRLPGPSKRELKQREKEERLEQIENGVVPVQVGEPRENAFIPPPRKKRRVKYKESGTIEESQRKRAKKEKRALARRKARKALEEIIDRTTGSEVKEHGTEDALVAFDGLGTAISDGAPTAGSPPRVVPLTHAPALTESEGNSFQTSGEPLAWSLQKAAIDHWRYGQAALHNDRSLDVPDLVADLEPAKSTGEALGTGHLLDPQFPSPPLAGSNVPLSEPDFFGDDTILSGPCNANILLQAPEAKVPNKAKVCKAPERHQVSPVSQNQIPTSMRYFGRASDLPTRLPSRDRLRVERANTGIFSEPLDYSNFSSKRSSGWSSGRSQTEMASKISMDSFLVELTGCPKNIPVPASTIYPRSQTQDRLHAVTPALSDGFTGITKGPAAGVLSTSGDTLDELSDDSFASATAASVYASPTGAPSSAVIYTSPRLFKPSDDATASAIADVASSVNISKLNAPMHMDYSRVRGSPSAGYGRTLDVPQLVTPSRNAFSEGNPVSMENCTSFSSNMSTGFRGEYVAAPQDMGVTIQSEKSKAPLPRTAVTLSPNVTLRPLAPAAPIVDRPSRTRTLTVQNTSAMRSAAIGDLESGCCDTGLVLGANTTHTRYQVEGTPPPFSVIVNRQEDAYPDTPPRASHTGIVPPASTPVSRSPLVYAMALSSAPWLEGPILPTYGLHVAEPRDAGGLQGLVLALKWAVKRTIGYFWQRRG